MNWDDVRIFLAIGQGGSVQAAARQLGINKSTVTRRIGAFEERLKVKLFERHATGYIPTAAGAVLLDTADHVHDTLVQIEQRLKGQDDAVEGRVRLSLPPGTLPLISHDVAQFLTANPSIELDLREDLRFAELSKFEADLAVRLSIRPPVGLHGRKIGQVAATLYASEAYLQSMRGQVSMRFIGPSTFTKGPAGHRLSYGPAHIVARADDPLTRRELAERGVGVTWLPCCIGDLSPVLQRIPGLNQLDMLEMWVLTHPSMPRTKRVTLTLKMLAGAAERMAAVLAGRKPRVGNASQDCSKPIHTA